MTSPKVKSKTNLLVLIAFITTAHTPVLAEDIAKASDLLVKVDSVYKVKDELGLFGIVVDLQANIAIFKPCHAPMIEIEWNRLEPTEFTCDDSAPPDMNPVQVSCASYEGVWNKGDGKSLELAMKTGSNSWNGGATQVFAVTTGSPEPVKVDLDSALPRLDAVSVFKNCGQLLTGFNSKGKAILNVYIGPSSDEASDEK